MTLQNFSVSCSAFTLVLVSASLNALFGYSWGRFEISGIMIDGLVLALAAIAADILKSQCLTKILQAFKKREFFRTLPAFVLLLVTACYSFVAAMGYVSTLRSEKSTETHAKNNAYARYEREYIQALADLKHIGSVRTEGEIQADIDSILLDPRAEGCREINGPYTREWCPKVKALQGELARSSQTKILRQKLDSAKHNLNTLQAPKDTDPQVTFIAKLTGLEKETVSLFLSILVSLLIEIGSICGFALVRSSRSETVKKVLPAKPPQNDKLEEPLDREGALDWLRHNGQAANGFIEATNRTLATIWGVSASTVNRWLKDWEKQSVLRLETCSGRTTVVVL